jgi:uncharacterized membrane protein YgdD (TMEM256/DUF423 family)
MQRIFLAFSGISGFMAVLLGALAAHSLKNSLSAEHLSSFETAAKYQIYHSLALTGIVFLSDKFNNKYLKLSGYFFITGILLFSGSIYILSTTEVTGFTNISWLGPVTPIGGMCLLAGWINIFLSAIIKK